VANRITPIERARPDSATRAPASVALASTDDAAEWDAYVTRQPGATIHQLFGWKIVAEQSYGLRAPFLAARDAETRAIRGVLPLVYVPRPFTQYLTSGLFGAYGPLLADDEDDARALLVAAMGRVDAGEGRHVHLRLLGDVPPGLRFDRQDVWVTAKLDLGLDEDALWQSLPRKQRWAVRHARRFGLEASSGPQELDGFYDVLFDNMHRKGAPIYGRGFFRWVLRTLGSRFDIVTLRDGGRVVSGALVAAFNGTLYMPFSSSYPEYFRRHANHLLFWEVMRHAQALGCRTLDLGSSLRGSTVLDFKLGWRPRLEPIGSYTYAARGTRPTLDPRDSGIAAAIVAAWARVPPRLARVLGPPLCRWIA